MSAYRQHNHTGKNGEGGGQAPAQVAFDRQWGGVIDRPHLRGAVRPLQMGMDWRGHRVLAFAGIAHPEKFFATLRGLGAELVHAEPLSDHQPLTPALFQRLEMDAARLGAQLVTTEKAFRAVRQGIGLLLQNADDQIIYPTVLDDVAFGP